MKRASFFGSRTSYRNVVIYDNRLSSQGNDLPLECCHVLGSPEPGTRRSDTPANLATHAPWYTSARRRQVSVSQPRLRIPKNLLEFFWTIRGGPRPIGVEAALRPSKRRTDFQMIFCSRVMNWKRSLILAIAFLGATSAKADLLTLDASGTFADGATLSGTLTINTTTGVATAADLIVSAPDSLTFDFIQFQGLAGPIYEIQTGTAATR